MSERLKADWLIYFEDASMDVELIHTGEESARARLTALQDNWNCHLFKRCDEAASARLLADDEARDLLQRYRNDGSCESELVELLTRLPDEGEAEHARAEQGIGERTRRSLSREHPSTEQGGALPVSPQRIREIVQNCIDTLIGLGVSKNKAESPKQFAELRALADHLEKAPAAPQCGTPEDYEEYLSALQTAFGEDMGDGSESTLTCEIERLKRLAEQAVAMRQHFGEAAWYLDGDGVTAFLKGLEKAPARPGLTRSKTEKLYRDALVMAGPKQFHDEIMKLIEGKR